jgi:hypothetical protein
MKQDTEKTIKLSCTIEHETEKAVLIVHDDQKAWLPKSLVGLDKLPDGTAVVVVPDWLAAGRKLI